LTELVIYKIYIISVMNKIQVLIKPRLGLENSILM
jgi:hypothetical protein